MKAVRKENAARAARGEPQRVPPLERKFQPTPISPAIIDEGGFVIGRRFEWAKVPSWRRYGDGSASLRLVAHAHAKWVGLTMEEGCEINGRWIGKQTSVTLNKAQAEALRDTLNTVLGGSARLARLLVGHPHIVHTGREQPEQPHNPEAIEEAAFLLWFDQHKEEFEIKKGESAQLVVAKAALAAWKARSQ